MAGLMIALTHGPLGLKVLDRGIIFIDLAIAQIAGFGLIIAKILWHEYSLIHQIVAFLFALSGALFFYLIEKKSPKMQEAIIGSSFILIASLSMLVLASQPHGIEEIRHLLSGQILFVTWSDIVTHAPIYLITISLWFLYPNLRNNIGFYIIFALVITSSVQLAGIYVVFASLIIPAIIAKNNNNTILASWFYGAVAIFIGVGISALFDSITGPTIVISYVLVAIMVTILRFFRRAR